MLFTYNRAGQPVVLTSSILNELDNIWRIARTINVYDRAGRIEHTYDFGTNSPPALPADLDGLGGWASWRAALPAQAAAPFTYLHTGFEYDAVGNLSVVTNPAGRISKTTYDALARTTKTVENWTKDEAKTHDRNRTTEYTYNGIDKVTALTSYNVKPDGSQESQTTTYRYGNHGVSNDLLSDVTHPMPPGHKGLNIDGYFHNALGEVRMTVDRNAIRHMFTRDGVGRMVRDEAGWGGESPIDKWPKALTYSYDTFGRRAGQASWNTAGDVTNSTALTYNGFGQPISETQDHGAPGPGGVPDLTVGYEYEVVGNTSRLLRIDYPLAEDIRFAYFGEVSQPRAVMQGEQQIENYKYLGLSTILKRERPAGGVQHPQPTLSVTLDAFARPAAYEWKRNGQVVDDTIYQRDAVGNIKQRTRSQLGDGSETIEYDDLHRPTYSSRRAAEVSVPTNSRRPLSPAPISPRWKNDTQGNRYGGPFGTGDYVQNRSASVSYSDSGQVTKTAAGPAPGSGKVTMQYDAWGRLTRLGGDREQIFQYDAADRMIRIGVVEGTLVRWRDLWYAGEQVILETTNDIAGNPVARKHYAYAPDGLLTRRLRDSDSNGTLDETLYALHDADGSVIAVTDGTGKIVQQFIYNIDGGVTGLTKGRVDSTWLTDYDWRHLWRQMRLADTRAANTPTTQTYVVYDGGGGKFYAPGVARWLQPAGPAGTDKPGFWGFFWPQFWGNVGHNLRAVGNAINDPVSVVNAIENNYDQYSRVGVGLWNATVLQFNPLTGLAEGIEGRSYQTGDFGRKIDAWDRTERGIISAVNTAATVIGGAAAWRMLSVARPPSITTLVGRNSPQRAVLLQHVQNMRANVRAMRAANRDAAAVRNAVQEIKGVVYGSRRMMARGYELLAANLHNTSNQGIDLVFHKGATYAVLEAKAGSGGGILSALVTDSRGLTQGSQPWIGDRLRNFVRTFGPDVTRASDVGLARVLQAEQAADRLRSFASFYGNRRLFQLPQSWIGPGVGPNPLPR